MSEQSKRQMTYADAGVDIDAGNRAVELMKESVPMLTPSGEVMFSRNLITSSKLSSGTPMPMSTMCEMRSPISFWAV